VITDDLDVGPGNQGTHGRDAGDACGRLEAVINELPDPVLTQVYRLKAVLGAPLDFGDVPAGHRRVVPLVAGTFTGPELNGNLLPEGSAFWQIVQADGTALTEIRYTLRTDRGALLYVRSRGFGKGHHEVVSRLGEGKNLDPDERLVHAATRIETAAPHLDWLNERVFVTVARRTTLNMVYEIYLVG
jgi:Protein of unknown function (DUF3237)